MPITPKLPFDGENPWGSKFRIWSNVLLEIISGKANVEHTHTLASIPSLQELLNKKADNDAFIAGMSRLAELEMETLPKLEADLGILNTETLPRLALELEENDARLANLNDVVLPQVNADLAANQTIINSLNEVILPGIQESLAENNSLFDEIYYNVTPEMRDQIDEAKTDLNELIETTLPALNQTLVENQNEIDTLKDVTLPALDAALTINQSNLDNLQNVVVPAMNAGLQASEAKVTNLQTNVIPALEVSLGIVEDTAAQAKLAADAAITETVIQYAQGASSTVAPISGWSVTSPTHVAGQYIWMRTVITYGSGANNTSGAVLVTGNSGSSGSSGKGISSIVEQYYLSTSPTALVGGSWVTTTPEWINGRYYWTRSVITYTDSTTTTTNAVNVSGAQGATGLTSYFHTAYATNATGTTGFSTSDPTGKTYVGTYSDFTEADSTTPGDYSWVLIKGSDGAAGKGVATVVVNYAKGSSGVTAPSTGWGTSVPTAAAGEFVWSRTVTTFTDSAVTTAYSVGKIGDTGSTGKGITSAVVTYQVASSGTTTPTGSWLSTVPSVPKGQFLWTRTVTTYSDTTTTTGYSVSQAGVDGVKGADGRSITSVDVWYYSSTSATALSGGTWATTAPAWDNGRYIWSKTITTYSSGTPTESNPAPITGGAGSTGAQGVSITSTNPFFRLAVTGATAPAQPSGTGDPSGWTTTEPDYQAQRELYRTERVLYSNSTATWTPVTKVAAFTAAVSLKTEIDANKAIVDTLKDVTLPALNARVTTTESGIQLADKRITISTSTPSSTAGYPDGAYWILVDGSNREIGYWRLIGSTWTATTLDPVVIPYLSAAKITSGTIDTGRLNTSEIAAAVATVIQLNADRITAGTINTDRLSANEVAAAVGTFLTLNASQVTAGTMSADRIDVTTFNAKVVNTPNLNAANITTGAMSADRIDVTTFNAKVIAVDNLNADRIKAGTINSDRLNAVTLSAKIANVVTVNASNIIATAAAFSNAFIEKMWTEVIRAKKIYADQIMVGSAENLVKDPTVTDVAGMWDNSSMAKTDGGRLGGGSILIPSASGNTGLYTTNTENASIFLDPLTQYRISVYAYPSTALAKGSFNVYLREFSAGTWVSGTDPAARNVTWDSDVIATLPANTWTKLTGTLTTYANTRYANLGLYVNGAVQVRYSDPVVRGMLTGQLVVDGSIHGSKITADTITASQIATNAITANELAVNSVNASHIVANSITATEIATNAITADELAANSVNASHIVANSITATEIAANTIGAGQITANSIGAGQITANSIGAGQINASSIEARHLTSELVLASKVQAGPSSLSHTFMDPSGLHFMSKIGSAPVRELLRINAPAGGDDEAEVFSLRKGDDLATSVMSISEAGTGSFSSLSSDGMLDTEGFRIAGETIEKVLSVFPRGVIEIAGINPSGTVPNGARFGIGQIGFIPEPNRLYAVRFEGVNVNAVGGWVSLQLRWGSNATPADTASADYVAARFLPGAGHSSFDTVRYLRTGDTLAGGVVATEGIPLYCRLDLQCGASSTATFNTDSNIRATVTDLGSSLDNPYGRTWTTLGRKVNWPGETPPTTPAPAPAKKDYTNTWDCNNLRSYNISTSNYNSYYSNKAGTGSYTSTEANRLRGRMHFGSLATTLSGADIVSVEAYVYMGHWQWNVGGSGLVGYHTSTDSAPATLSTNGTSPKAFSTLKPGGAWVTMDSSCHAGVKSGAVRAFILSSPGVSKDYWGYATSGKIRVKYRK